MRIVFTLLLGLIIWSSSGQITIRPIVKPFESSSRLGPAEEQSPLTLPFWDDFSTSHLRPDTLWEFSDGVTIGSGFSKNPPTFNAAALDGVDSLGRPYDDQNTFPGLSDQLISRRIDLSALINDESIYMSFFWQSGGFSEIPEDPGDSLRLQALNSDSVWVTLWKIHAIDVTTTEEFAQEILKIEAPYRHRNFRFKFETFGNQFGPFDTWHVDYVYLNNGRSSADLTYFDRAMSGSISSLIDPWREMPAEHFFESPDEFIVNQSFVATNLRETPHTLVLQYDLHDTDSDVVYSFVDSNNGLLAGEVKEVTLVETPSIPAQDPAPDSVVFNLDLSSNFNDPSSPIDYGVNDTISTSYTFHNYYAYDDGVPEFAAGVGQNGSVAIEYVIAQEDTLSHVDLYFPTIFPSPVGISVTVSVWTKLDGSDPVETQNLTIAEEDLNRFTRIRLTRPVIVEDTIYVGYKQKTVDFLGVGLDKNTPSAKSKMWYLRDEWVQNINLDGIMMIRPVFQNLNDIPIGTRPELVTNFFPNPVENELTIEDNYTEIRVWNMSGKLLLKEPKYGKHNLSSLKSGVYVLEIVHRDRSERSLLRKD